MNNIKSKNNTISILITFVTVFGLAWTGTWGFVEVFADIDGKYWKIIFQIVTSLLLAVLFLLYRLWDKEVLPKSKKQFCSVSKGFDKEYPDFAVTEALKDRSDLWYIFINTRNFNDTKLEIEKYFSKNNKNKAGRLTSNLQVWSLLGASELLLKFRAHEQDGYDIFNGLKTILSSKSLLEQADKNSEGIQIIDCAEERVRHLYNPNQSLFEGKHEYIKKLGQDYRYTKIFIKFQFENGRLISGVAERITNILNNDLYKPYVEIFTYTERSSPNQFALIELIFPCGRKTMLNKISTALANECLDEGLFKETFMGYDIEMLNITDAKRNP